MGASRTSSFDPYHKWLGIPPDEQPANHYRLLDVSLFESDPQVIDAAAARQAAYLQSCSTGPYVALSQKLLGEVVAARLCLLNATMKAAYDERLRALVTSESARRGPAAVPLPSIPSRTPAAAPADLEDLRHFEYLDATRSTPISTTTKSSRDTRKSTVPFIAQIVLGGIAGLAAGYMIISYLNPNNPLVAKRDAAVQSSDKGPARKSPLRPPAKQIIEPQRPSLPSLPPAKPLPYSSPLSPKSTQPLPQVPNSIVTMPANAVPPPSAPVVVDRALEPEFRPPSVPNEVAPASKPAATATPPEDARVKADLDFSRAVTRVPLPNAADTNAAVRIGQVVGLGTPHEVVPNHGTLKFGQPVDIKLTDYPNIRLHVTLKNKDEPVAEIAAEVDVTGKKLPFTNTWIKRAGIRLNNEADDAGQRLRAAIAEANSIDAWLRTPVTKPVPLRRAKVEQLRSLRQQAIPALQQQFTAAQARSTQLERLSDIIKHSHGAAAIEFVLAKKPAATAP